MKRWIGILIIILLAVPTLAQARVRWDNCFLFAPMGSLHLFELKEFNDDFQIQDVDDFNNVQFGVGLDLRYYWKFLIFSTDFEGFQVTRPGDDIDVSLNNFTFHGNVAISLLNGLKFTPYIYGMLGASRSGLEVHSSGISDNQSASTAVGLGGGGFGIDEHIYFINEDKKRWRPGIVIFFRAGYQAQFGGSEWSSDIDQDPSLNLSGWYFHFGIGPAAYSVLYN